MAHSVWRFDGLRYYDLLTKGFAMRNLTSSASIQQVEASGLDPMPRRGLVTVPNGKSNGDKGREDLDVSTYSYTRIGVEWSTGIPGLVVDRSSVATLVASATSRNTMALCLMCVCVLCCHYYILTLRLNNYVSQARPSSATICHAGKFTYLGFLLPFSNAATEASAGLWTAPRSLWLYQPA